MSFAKSLAKLRRHEEPGRAEWLIIGLGNPGGQYAKTRHNIGFMCLNRIAQKTGVRFRNSGKDRADVAPTTMSGVTVLLAQPLTFMNESGGAVERMMRRLSLGPDRVLLIYDDVDLPFGTIRVREEGSAGGHRGVRSVIERTGTSEISRIRIGIGRAPEGTKDYVLSEFPPQERQAIPAICDRVFGIVEVVVTEGVIAAMNRFNGQAATAVGAR